MAFAQRELLDRRNWNGIENNYGVSSSNFWFSDMPTCATVFEFDHLLSCSASAFNLLPSPLSSCSCNVRRPVWTSWRTQD